MANNYNNDAYYGTSPQFPLGSSTSSSQPNESQRAFDRSNPEMMTFAPSDPLRLGDYAFSQPHGSDMLLSSVPPGALESHANELLPSSASNLPVSTAHLADRLSNALFAYDPLSGIGSSMSMALDAASAFAYDPSSGYSQATAPFENPFNRQAIPQRPSFHPPTLGLEPSVSYTQGSTRNSYWASSLEAKEMNTTIQAAAMTNRSNSSNSKSTDSSRTQQLPHRRRPDPPPPTQVSSHGASHRYIQPKRPSPMKNSSGKSATGGETTPYTSIYSSSGINMMSILAEVVSRPDPKINIGAVDLSCAFVLCDIYQEDHPIVYVSDAFVRLTGYTEDEIVGHNCRFLQDPNGQVQAGTARKFVDQQTAFRLRSTIEDRNEIQATLINYRKGGQPFMNLITMIPVRWTSPDYRFYVGFQVDLVEKPDAITRRNPNGTYMINYQRNQLPNYVVPPPDIYRTHPDLATYFSPDQVSTILDNLASSDPNHQQYLDRVLVENTDDVIHVLSLDGEFLYLSPSCRKALEYDSYELVGKTLSTVCHPSDIGPVIRELRSCTSSDPISVMYRIRTKFSGYVWFESHGAWHISDRGRQYMVMTGRVRPVYHLDQIAKIGDGGLAENDLWAKLSISGIILFISSKARPVLGRLPDDLVGKSIQDLIGPDSRLEAQQALEVARTGQQTSFNHKIRHKKGHMLQAQTVLYPGDTKEGTKPSFLVAQLRFPKSPQAEDVVSTDLPAVMSTGDISVVGRKDGAAADQSTYDMSALVGSNSLPSGNQYIPDLGESSLFTELSPTRGSSWQFELRELEKQNRILSDEVQRLLARRKKRKRKQSTVPVEKSCAMCQTRTTPEWRRGPSGNRDLCNSCGLRWAKQVRNAAQAAA
ncbi:GATA transcription factor LreA [Aspergillus clavatus NRRL 1]|uniref:GATA transcription factor LreA n=1 Tax=Aspergillus clavatus (strain ATCC 1007 / CBS 513.65 / DSM 816 / NCTC 3887 / NRRL 1 / QM 1276 / 107) TaxID=344612 RepID=A1CJ49_ASPCL|nr:GATA transcription factor LreA [Aspergillus clavatus NRRL 1]EAW09173.1 GATA transcription factor LreA [Aspergillus clavatus NRRL 1]